MKKITLVPISGLCNRMNAILSALALHQQVEEITISIYWPKTNDCNCRFSDLFKPISDKYLKGLSFSELHSFILSPPSRRNLKFTTLLRKPFFDAEYLGSRISNQSIEEILELHQNCYIYSDNRFCRYSIDEKIGDVFVPIDYLLADVEENKTLFSSYTVGVHVRRTDNLVSIKNSPIEQFYALMNREIEEHPCVKFYLATDSREVKKQLVKKYGSRIIYQKESELARNTVKGMQEAVVDLYSLASTNKIIGSHGSTFSSMAGKLFGVPVIYDLD